MVYGGWVLDTLGIMTNSLWEGTKTTVSTGTSMLVSGGKKAGMFMLESVGGSVGLVGNMAIRGVGYGVLGSAISQTRSQEDAEALLDLAPHVSRMTIVGRLPNAPGFDNALQEKTEELSQEYNQQKSQLGGSQKAALDLIDQIDLNGAQRGGNDQALSPDEFHTALLLGAHFTTSDTTLYDQVHSGALGDFVARGSSHYKNRSDQQYGIDIAGLGHLLIGKSGDGSMFFQFESHGLGNPNMTTTEKISEGIGHTLSYVQHITGDMNYVQLGPKGCISASEKDGQQVVLN